MNAQQQLQLEDAQKKLSTFRKHLDLLARCSGESKNVDPNEVLSAVSELQSLVEWAAQKPELGTESAVLLVKLQELHQIRENLEKTSTDTDESSYPSLSCDEETTIPEKSESYSKDIEYISNIVPSNLHDNNGDNLEEDISIDKDSLGDYSASTEERNIANAESPDSLDDTNIGNVESFEDTNIDIAESPAIFEDTNISIVESPTSLEDKNLANAESPAIFEDTIISIVESPTSLEDKNLANAESPGSLEDTNAANVESPVSIEDTIVASGQSQASLENTNAANVESPVSVEDTIVASGESQASLENTNVANVESPASLEDTNIDIIPNDGKTDQSVNIDEIHDLHPGIEKQEALNEDEISQKISEVQEIPTENKIELPDTSPDVPEVKSPNLFRSEVIIIETDEDDKSTELVNNSENSNDPLDVCMYAIRNLYESLRVKENELLKLSAMQNDQKHIEALQAVIIDFHKDITNLHSDLEKSKKENALLKEQVLELEEAENDARLEAQKLEQKLVFLQEKDSHSQAELSQLKQSLKKSTEALAEKESSEKELKSQLKYMETLVQKYEDQIKVMEAKETANKKDLENLQKKEASNVAENARKRKACTKGTQTYEPRQTKINSVGDISADIKKDDAISNDNQTVQILDESEKTGDKTSENNGPSTNSAPSSAADETAQDKSDFDNIENSSQKELLKRLHKLIDEDVSLQQQIHYVDEINLAMWKKLQNLDCHIGECKRQNINETNPVVSETELDGAGCGNSSTEIKEPSTTSTNQNIPEENLSCLDQSEQYIQERLTKLEEINASFEKELKTRENLCKEKEKKYEEWLETEKRIIDDLKRLADEKEWITDQINKLTKEQKVRQTSILRLEEEITALKGKNQTEVNKIRLVQDTATEPLNHKVNQMLIKEKEILKMITNLKSQKNRSQGKNDLERLKCNYIELQLELSQARDEIRKIEDEFKFQFDQCTNKHLMEENPRTSELERLRNDFSRSDKMISNLQMKYKSLLSALEKQEEYLQNTRESYKKNIEETEEEHRSVETELKSHLQQIEEGTAIATTALMEERMKVEKELHDNIEDLKAKEEVYKAKIAELESDVCHLHDELHKLATESESKKEVLQVRESIVEVNTQNSEMECSKKDLKNVTQTASQPKVEDILTPSRENTIKEPTPPIKSHVNFVKENMTEKDVPEENVDELRAQVRELQSELEKISVEEVPPVQPVKPITTKSLKMQKVEDIDYAEVDECSLDAWRKNTQNIPVAKNISPNVQAVYGDKYSTGYKDSLQNNRRPVKETVEENDYDEVLPRPTNFHIVQQVGSDTLLVGWNYVNPSVLDGFEVYLNDQVHERIYIPDRTKALISGLNLRKPIRLSICALSRYGQMSEPAVLEISQGIHTQYLEDEDEYRDIEDPMKRNSRPYSMEW